MSTSRTRTLAAAALALALVGLVACGGSSDDTTADATSAAAAATSAAAEPATTAEATTAAAATTEAAAEPATTEAATTEAATSAAATTEPAPAGVAKTTITMGSPKEFSMVAADTVLAAGSVTFTVANEGTIKHEAVVVPAPDGLDALRKPDGEAREKGSAGEIVLEAGKSGEFTVDVTPGQWALLCNLPGHYAGGMATLVTVS